MIPYNQSLVEIPELFHSVEFDGPFQKCQICTRELFHDSQSYLIEKVFRGQETIIEIATCLPCAMEMQSKVSAESMQIIQKEFNDKVVLTDRLDWLSESDSEKSVDDGATESTIDQAPARPDTDKWLEKCILSGKPRSESESFQIVGMFMGDQMVLSVFPYLIDSKAIEELGEKLSESTRGFMQDFIDTQFGMPPEFCSPDSPLPLLI